MCTGVFVYHGARFCRGGVMGYTLTNTRTHTHTHTHTQTRKHANTHARTWFWFLSRFPLRPVLVPGAPTVTSCRPVAEGGSWGAETVSVNLRLSLVPVQAGAEGGGAGLKVTGMMDDWACCCCCCWSRGVGEMTWGGVRCEVCVCNWCVAAHCVAQESGPGYR